MPWRPFMSYFLQLSRHMISFVFTVCETVGSRDRRGILSDPTWLTRG